MDGEIWRWAISAGITVNLFLLSMILRMFGEMKKDVQNKLREICEENKGAHMALWERIHHHAHTEKGEVVITE